MQATDYLSREEIRNFSARSDLAGARMLLLNWLAIAAIFAFVAQWTNPLTVLVAIVLLGGRQLGLSVLMHEAGHGTLFRTPWMNRVFGQYLAAYPLLSDCAAYSTSHREHHRLAGTREDPDLPNYDRYPIDRASFKRKLWRDISGQTGLKLLVGIFRGYGNRMNLREDERTDTVAQGLASNAVLLGILWLCGAAWLYLLWVAAYLTTFLLAARIRQVAEHGAVRGLYELDPRLNTRTTLPRWYERLYLCPNYVNYHLEHHLLAAVPAHRLPALHRTLYERGFFDEFPDAIARGYGEVIRTAVPEYAGGQAASG